ncbi:Stand-alone HD-GYP domain protein [Anoxybacillus flavithermus WK1]|uniref:Stand-alone HD-GYP domain protein n=3 Tax=Anoxybacillus TaxID=150247 RepID=B7GF64_ANOFW|nr:Stand-alone HD-GYP domain protein [Anoxybacillus flavithermus WK1]
MANYMSFIFKNMELCFLMRQLSMKDEFTFLHSYRVTKIALSFASFLKLTDQQKRELQFGALIHDIGKLYVPAHILTKKGKLSKEEFDEMKKHPLFGIRVLQDYHVSTEISHIVLYHHERWDGKGYPNKQSGENIPFLARLVSLADSLEAMTGIRPYRTSLTWEEAYEEIKKGGKHTIRPTINHFFFVMNGKSRDSY